jgi:hypothetical protein
MTPASVACLQLPGSANVTTSVFHSRLRHGGFPPLPVSGPFIAFLLPRLFCHLHNQFCALNAWYSEQFLSSCGAWLMTRCLSTEHCSLSSRIFCVSMPTLLNWLTLSKSLPSRLQLSQWKGRLCPWGALVSPYTRALLLLGLPTRAMLGTEIPMEPSGSQHGGIQAPHLSAVIGWVWGGLPLPPLTGGAGQEPAWGRPRGPASLRMNFWLAGPRKGQLNFFLHFLWLCTKQLHPSEQAES